MDREISKPLQQRLAQILQTGAGAHGTALLTKPTHPNEAISASENFSRPLRAALHSCPIARCMPWRTRCTHTLRWVEKKKPPHSEEAFQQQGLANPLSKASPITCSAPGTLPSMPFT